MGLKAALQGYGDRFRIVGEARSGKELFALLEREPCDLLITDFAMPGDNPDEDGLAMLARVREGWPQLPILVLTMLSNPALVQGMLATGVRGVVDKMAMTRELMLAIDMLKAGRVYLSERTRRQIEGGDETSALSPREAEVVRFLAQGVTVSEIARRTGRSVKTISQQKRDAMGKPRVSFREAFGKTVEHTYTHKKQSGGSGQFAEVKVIFERGEPGSGVVFSDEIVGGRVPREYIPAVEHAITVESREGQVAGYEVLDFKARLVDGKYHDVDSSALAFEIAGKACFREAHKLSNPKLLEPVMKLEVVTEADYLGDVIGDINRRRGSISDQGQRGTNAFVQGFVPLAEMFGYINFLRSATSGRGTFTMEFDHYEEVPASMVAKLMEKEGAK